MDGFVVNKTFYCKELGIIRIGDVAARSFIFDIGLQLCDLSAKDRKSCKYVMRFIHKLPFGVSPGTEAIKISALESIVSDFYPGVKRDAGSVSAYKGGQYTRNLLTSLGIPSLKLESFGCPKVVGLIDQLVWLETCGKHTANNAYLHCPKVEKCLVFFLPIVEMAQNALVSERSA